MEKYWWDNVKEVLKSIGAYLGGGEGLRFGSSLEVKTFCTDI